MQGNEADKESIASVETTSLLQRLLPNSSPLSELQVFLVNASKFYIKSRVCSTGNTWNSKISFSRPGKS